MQKKVVFDDADVTKVIRLIDQVNDNAAAPEMTGTS